jgi:hypothetical protein
MECRAPGVEEGQVPDLEVAVVPLKARDCQQKAEVLQTLVSRHRSRVSSAAVVEVGDLGSQRSTKLSLCSVEQEGGWRISLPLRLAAAL